DGAAPHTMSARPMDVVHDGTRPRPRAARAAGEAIDRVPHEPAGTRIADAPSFAPLVGDRGGHRGPAPAAVAQGPIDAAAALRREAAPNVRVTIGRVEVRANLRADARAGTSMQAR